MKYLKIEGNLGKYTVDDGATWINIDEIGRDDLLLLLDKAFEGEFEIDEFIGENIQNKAHQIIYKNISERLNELKETKTQFKDATRTLYEEDLKKYCTTGE